ncbi:uncharacterized protein LOC111687690 isoform X1 [Lucilia cuprina]|uniref:uncharacterized protein LOC111687690 isoform X1 n=1 Tax=Lucilia cuprina TaxID=7375 RepID=UPI001F05A180|nr:uncharacterized protein LOC111687690 isoform X1 [Lucilia cuprina]XP_023305926.2 uncharacterized protein LOC111687690 isoform X1 [Lucilia cuprina]XP_046808264.1 uncharacterized protein LOC111687690 isoform X1 [Lucilia cuprina]
MSFSMNKLKSILPGTQNGSMGSKRQSESLEPEIGFQISIEANASEQNGAKTVIPELNVNLIAARHLPALFGFKIVQGYLIKVKLFPGHKRLDSSIQTNSWPKFNETFKFPLAPDIKPSMKHSSRRGSKSTALTEFTPEELFAGQFVVFTVYALLELPPTSFNRFSKTYRSLKDKSSNLMQNIFETSPEKPANDDKENKTKEQEKKTKRKSQDINPRDSMPPLTISESRRNLGSVTCYLQPKLFKRNSRGMFATEELWMPIKDINTTVKKPSNDSNNNQLANSTKGVVELVLQIQDCSEPIDPTHNDNGSTINIDSSTLSLSNGKEGSGKSAQSWNRMTSEMKRKMGMRNVNTKTPHGMVLKITTARMRCTNKVKDELEATAGSVYVKTTVFEHGIYIDSWKSPNFYPSLSTKWEVGNVEPTITIPLQSLDNLDNILIRTTLATKTKMAKKLVLGTVVIGGPCAGASVSDSGAEHMATLRETALNERVAMWHSYQ